MNTAYLILKTAHGLYGKAPTALAAGERERVEKLAARQFELEHQVLVTDEARDVVVPEATLTTAYAEVRGRYASNEEFAEDLAGNGLDPAGFRAALERELKVEAVLEKVGGRAARVSDIDVALYYQYHPEQFRRPETRLARHILITINEDLPENGRAATRARMEAIAARLAREPKRFEEQAMKHSECPTALNGGLLGEVRRGQLFPELDAALFELAPGTLSGILESELGWHLLRCDQVTEAGILPLPLVMEKIREMLAARRKRICQSAWLSQARAPAISG